MVVQLAELMDARDVNGTVQVDIRGFILGAETDRVTIRTFKVLNTFIVDGVHYLECSGRLKQDEPVHIPVDEDAYDMVNTLMP